ncbi:MAG TPA: non-ribosomal peptide synthetase [Polyangiaceae bacterium]|nr:non-ribosomal peptide synthetase [Polyangiaceae bacterium]
MRRSEARPPPAAEAGSNDTDDVNGAGDSNDAGSVGSVGSAGSAGGVSDVGGAGGSNDAGGVGSANGAGSAGGVGSASAAYRDFAAQQGAYQGSEEAAKSLGFWRDALADRLAGGAPAVGAASERAPGATIGFFEIPPTLKTRLEAKAGLLKHALWSLFTACWGALLARREHRSSVVVGFPVNLREAPFAQTVGNFVNPLPIALDVAPGARLTDLAHQALAQISRAASHKRMPLSAIVGGLRRAGLSVASPPYRATLNYLKDAGAGRFTDLHIMRRDDVRIPWGGLQLAPFFVPQQEGQVELALEVMETAGGLRGYVRSGAGIAGATVERLRDELLALLEAFATEPTVSVEAALAAAATAEATPATARSATGETLVSLLDRVARERPDVVAVSDEGASLSYEALVARSLDIAHALRAAGVRPGDRVGVLLPPSSSFIAAAVGVMRAGAAYVPLSPDLPAARLAQIADRCAITTAIGGADATRLDAARVRVLRLEDVATGAAHFDLSRDEGLAYTLFTSGSTGQPKGIDVRHRNVLALLRATAALVRTDPSDAWCWFHAASFDLSVWEIFGPLLSGARVVVARPEHRHDPRKLVQLLRSAGVTVLQLTPSALRLLKGVTAGGPPPVALKHIVSCGEALPADTANYFLPWTRSFWNMYGPAETTVYATYFEVIRPLDGGGYVPVGEPLAGYRVHLLDERLEPVAFGEVGEMFIAGDGVAAGYANDPAATATRFLPDRDGGADGRVYRTGDFARLAEGGLHYIGRRDHQTKVHGYRVDLLEIEDAIRAWGRVRDAAVTCDNASGENRLHAFVVFEPAPGADEKVRLEDWLAGRLPAYMIPTAYTTLPALPLNAHGKVDRAALRAAPGEAAARRPAAKSRSKEELVGFISARWREISGRAHCPPDVSFFDMGGDSFMIVRLQGALREHEAFADLETTDIFKYPKIEALAALAAAEAGADEAGGTFRRSALRRPRRAAARKG